MSVTKVRGNIQIQSTTITDEQFVENASIETSKLAEGSELIKRSGSVAFAGNLDFGSNKLGNLSAPINSHDITRKTDLDAATSGVFIKQPMYPEFGDGTNTFFQTHSDVSSNTEKVYVNGVLQRRGASYDYTIINRGVTFNTAPGVGDSVTIEYFSGLPIVSNTSIDPLINNLTLDLGGTSQTSAQQALNTLVNSGAGSTNQIIRKDAATGDAKLANTDFSVYFHSRGGDIKFAAMSEIENISDEWTPYLTNYNTYINSSNSRFRAYQDTRRIVSNLTESVGGNFPQKNLLAFNMPDLEGTWPANYSTEGTIVGTGKSIFWGVKTFSGNVGIGSGISYSDLDNTSLLLNTTGDHIKINVSNTMTPGAIGDAVTMIFKDPNSNDVYISGGFSQKYSAEGVNATSNTSLYARGLVKWNGTSFTEIYDGTTNRTYACAAADTLGNIYFGASDGIYKYTTSSQTFVKWKTTNGTVIGIYINPSNNYMHMIGDFTIIDGVSINRAAWWNGSTMNSMGTGGVNGRVNGMVHDGNGNLYCVSGNSVTFGGTSAASGIAKYNIASDTWTALPVVPFFGSQTTGKFLYYYNNKLVLAYTPNFAAPVKVFLYNPSTNSYEYAGKGMNGAPYATGVVSHAGQSPFAIGSDGALYVGTTANRTGTSPIRGLAKYATNGIDWSDVNMFRENSGFEIVTAVCAVGDDLYVGGYFDRAGNVSAKNIAKYNITTGTWSSLDTGGLQGTTTLERSVTMKLSEQGNLTISKTISKYTDWNSIPSFRLFKSNGVTAGTVIERLRMNMWRATTEGNLQTSVMVPNVSGSFPAFTNVGGSYYPLRVNAQIFAANSTIATSELSYKENIKSIDRGLDYIQRLNPVSFFWKQEHQDTYGKEKAVGFIAQQVQYALEESGYADAVVKDIHTDESGNKVLGLIKADIIPFLVKGIQELDQKKKELEDKLASLKVN